MDKSRGESVDVAGAEEANVPDSAEKVDDPTKPRKKLDAMARLKVCLERSTKVAIFSHAGPDPDGIGSTMAMCWMLSRMGIEAHGFYVGAISHPQNVAMVNLLDPDLKPIEEYQKDYYNLRILLDAVPANAGAPEGTAFDVVVDHHKESPNGGFNGIYINLKAGSTCATVHHILKEFGFNFEEGSDADTKVATALMVGIVTDTENLMSDDATEYEFRSWSELFDYRDPVSLKRIVNYERPKLWVQQEADAIQNVEIVEGVAIVGLGIIPAKHRDMIADMSSRMVTWEDVHTAIVFAIVDGERMEGSVRSNNASVMVPQLCKMLGGKHGMGGGKLGKGAYRYDLGGAGIDEEDDAETKESTWELFSKKELKRITRVINNK